jgi:hypothetical protein
VEALNMKTKRISVVIAKVLSLSVIMLVLWAAFVGLFTSLTAGEEASADSSAQDTAQILSMMLIVSIVHTSVLSLIISQAAWRGMKLASTIALQIFGIQFVLTLSEAAYFDSSLGLPDNFTRANLMGGACMAAVFSIAAVAIFGRMKGPHELPPVIAPVRRLRFALKFLILAALAYPLLYFLAGYLIAFRFDAVRIFYTGSAEQRSFLAAARDFWTDGLRTFQTIRGAVWILIALPVIRMLKARAWGTAIAVGLLFALLMNTQHLLPNQHMPAGIRAVHFIETASSNFLWGILVTLFMRGRLEYREQMKADCHAEQ